MGRDAPDSLDGESGHLIRHVGEKRVAGLEAEVGLLLSGGGFVEEDLSVTMGAFDGGGGAGEGVKEGRTGRIISRRGRRCWEESCGRRRCLQNLAVPEMLGFAQSREGWVRLEKRAQVGFTGNSPCAGDLYGREEGRVRHRCSAGFPDAARFGGRSVGAIVSPQRCGLGHLAPSIGR